MKPLLVKIKRTKFFISEFLIRNGIYFNKVFHFFIVMNGGATYFKSPIICKISMGIGHGSNFLLTLIWTEM